MADLLQTPYATAMPYIVSASAAGWTDEYDRQRLQAYNLYDDLYFNDPTAYKLLLRGSNDKPIYVPTAKKLISSLARYTGKDWGFVCTAQVADPADPTVEASTPEQLAMAISAFGNLFKRERLEAVYRAGVPEWLRRGDWLWFVSANPGKRAGSRISVRSIDPRRYFPLYRDPLDLSRLTGQQIIEETLLPDGKTVGLLVQTWLKWTDIDHPNFSDDPNAVEPDEGYDILYSVQAYDVADYADEEKRKALGHPSNLPEVLLSGIKNLPIYHIRNNETTDDPFGRSDLSGLESIIAGINQSASDEDLSLALMGLGMYWTNSGAPIDEQTKQITPWKLGPNRVIEVDEDAEFNKVDGITTVTPFQDHVSFIGGEAAGTMGLSDVSIGTKETTVASGISLAIQFSPTIDAVRNKNQTSNSVLTQMLHDLKQWFMVYEQMDMGTVVVESVTNDDNLLPFDREARWKELTEGVTAGVFTKEFAVEVLTKEFGYVFPDGYAKALEAAAATAAASLDPFAARAEQEAASAEEPTE